ncbi:MAG: AsmA family protein, partial [Deltaproteobacteria bacterium]|nr:AsmA family protein [Deltaproteobacteria bacterium]
MRRKKRRRIILSFIVILIVVIGIGIGLAHYFLSGERLKIILSEKMAEATGRPVTIAEVSVNPFGRLDIHGLDIGFTSEENMKQGSFFRLKHLGVRFRLLPLLKKHLVITEVTIDSPALNLVPPFGEEADAMETEVDSAKAGLGLQPLT